MTKDDHQSVQSFLAEGLEKPSLLKSVEHDLAKYLSRPTILCASGTAGLHLSLYAMNIGPGDEVIVPDLTFAATWNAVLYVGAKPVFCDVDQETWCIDVKDVKKKISSRTKAIIAVDLYGNTCNYTELNSLCKENDIRLIVDAAESLGSKFLGMNAAQYGDIAVTSFNTNKIITGFGGGSVSCYDESLLDKMKSLLNQSKIGSEYEYEDMGFNYRCHPLAASLIKNQLPRLDEIIQKKKLIYSEYKKNLNDQVFQKFTPGCSPNYWQVVVKLPSPEKAELINQGLQRNNIESKRIFSLGSSTLYEKSNSMAYNISRSSISLPCGPKIKKDQIDSICDIFRSFQ